MPTIMKAAVPAATVSPAMTIASVGGAACSR